MKIFLTAAAALALVACSNEPNEAATPNTTPDTAADSVADSGAAKAQTVSLKIAGMT
ncbi:MAG: hypothetical protein AAF726_13190 [Planctomycetota bacterium]